MDAINSISQPGQLLFSSDSSFSKMEPYNKWVGLDFRVYHYFLIPNSSIRSLYFWMSFEAR